MEESSFWEYNYHSIASAQFCVFWYFHFSYSYLSLGGKHNEQMKQNLRKLQFRHCLFLEFLKSHKLRLSKFNYDPLVFLKRSLMCNCDATDRNKM